MSSHDENYLREEGGSVTDYEVKAFTLHIPLSKDAIRIDHETKDGEPTKLTFSFNKDLPKGQLLAAVSKLKEILHGASFSCSDLAQSVEDDEERKKSARVPTEERLFRLEKRFDGFAKELQAGIRECINEALDAKESDGNKPSKWFVHTKYKVGNLIVNKAGNLFCCSKGHISAHNVEPGVGSDWPQCWDMLNNY